MFGFLRHRRRLFGAAILGLVLTPLAFAGGRMFGGPCGGPFGLHGDNPPTAEQIVGFITPIVDEVLAEIDARPDQEATIKAVIEESIDQMQAVHQRGRDLRERFRDALDRGASADELEALRAEGIKLADEGSRIAVDRIAEVRGALDEAQWKELQALHEQRMGGFGGWRR